MERYPESPIVSGLSMIFSHLGLPTSPPDRPPLPPIHPAQLIASQVVVDELQGDEVQNEEDRGEERDHDLAVVSAPLASDLVTQPSRGHPSGGPRPETAETGGSNSAAAPTRQLQWEALPPHRGGWDVARSLRLNSYFYLKPRHGYTLGRFPAARMCCAGLINPSALDHCKTYVNEMLAYIWESPEKDQILRNIPLDPCQMDEAKAYYDQLYGTAAKIVPIRSFGKKDMTTYPPFADLNPFWQDLPLDYSPQGWAPGVTEATLQAVHDVLGRHHYLVTHRLLGLASLRDAHAVPRGPSHPRVLYYRGLGLTPDGLLMIRLHLVSQIEKQLRRMSWKNDTLIHMGIHSDTVRCYLRSRGLPQMLAYAPKTPSDSKSATLEMVKDFYHQLRPLGKTHMSMALVGLISAGMPMEIPSGTEQPLTLYNWLVELWRKGEATVDHLSYDQEVSRLKSSGYMSNSALLKARAKFLKLAVTETPRHSPVAIPSNRNSFHKVLNPLLQDGCSAQQVYDYMSKPSTIARTAVPDTLDLETYCQLRDAVTPVAQYPRE